MSSHQSNPPAQFCISDGWFHYSFVRVSDLICLKKKQKKPIHTAEFKTAEFNPREAEKLP